MFGMSDKKKKESPKEAFLFDLEKELGDRAKAKEYAKRIEKHVLQIKELLRKGSKREDFDQLGVLLNGYHALAIILGRVAAQAQKK